MILLPITILGMFLGGFLIKKFKLHVTDMAKFACVTFIVAYLLNLLYFTCSCEVLQVAGLTVPYSGFVSPWVCVGCVICHGFVLNMVFTPVFLSQTNLGLIFHPDYKCSTLKSIFIFIWMSSEMCLLLFTATYCYLILHIKKCVCLKTTIFC